MRDGKDWQWPAVAHDGPLAMLVDRLEPVRRRPLSPLFSRGPVSAPSSAAEPGAELIGIAESLHLIDGGTVMVPTFGIYSKEGQWVVEARPPLGPATEHQRGSYRRDRSSKSTGSAHHTPPRWFSTTSQIPEDA